MGAKSNRDPSGPPPAPPDEALIREDVRRALAEDVGSGDVTSALIPASATAAARVVCREPAVLCGRPWFDQVFAQTDPGVTIAWKKSDGERLEKNDGICSLEGPARAMLTGERTALNFLQMLSGTATFARKCASIVEGTPTRILDTRKTLPGLRMAQKYAVRCGGATNHRFGLFDAYLIKENHIIAAGSIAAAVQTARKNQPGLTLEVEVDSLGQLDQAIDAGADIIMLDNFDPGAIAKAVTRTAGRAKLEVSGNVTLAQLRELAGTGIDFVSIGALTKNVTATDFSMRFDTIRN